MHAQKKLSILPKFVCNVIESAKREDQGFTTVAIVITETQLEHSIIDDMMRCMPMEISTTMIDLRLNEGGMDIKAQMIIMLADQIDDSNQMMTAILTKNHMSKFLIVISDPEKLNVQNVQKLLNSNGIQNYAIISQDAVSVVIQRPATFNGEVKLVRKIQKSQRLSRQMFPDKLRNLHGYKYKVAVDFSSYGVTSKNNRIVQRTAHMFRSIVKSQNASFTIKRIDDAKQSLDMKFDFIVNAKFRLQRRSSSLSLYNQNSFCILMPKVENTISAHAGVTNADGYIIICLAMTYILTFITWKLFQNRGAIESPGQIMFKILLVSLGQKTKFSRKNHPVLKMLIQILMFMSVFSKIFNQWHMGNLLAYPPGILNLDDTYKMFVKENDTKIAIDSVLIGFLPLLKSYHRVGRFLEKIELHDEDQFDLDKYDDKKLAVIGQCDFLNVLATQNQQFFCHQFPFIQTYIQINYESQSSLIDHLERMSSYAFEGGLSEYWETLIRIEIFGQHFQQSDAKIKENLFNVLRIEKCLPLVYFYLQGVTTAFVVFILEIFYHDFIRHMSWELLRRSIKLIAGRNHEESNVNINWQNIGRMRRAWYFWRQRKNMRVRRVNVKQTKH